MKYLIAFIVTLVVSVGALYGGSYLMFKLSFFDYEWWAAPTKLLVGIPMFFLVFLPLAMLSGLPTKQDEV